jgi:hypothetical protein
VGLLLNFGAGLTKWASSGSSTVAKTDSHRLLPTLGVIVFPEAVELSYRMGPEWGSPEVFGFFNLLRDCVNIDQTAVVVPADREGPPDPRRFSEVWNRAMQAAREEKFTE